MSTAIDNIKTTWLRRTVLVFVLPIVIVLAMLWYGILEMWSVFIDVLREAKVCWRNAQ